MAELVAGQVNYQATVWTKADNDSIHSIEETVGKKVAFTSMTGSSGFVRPMGTLVTDGHITIEGDDIVALEARTEGWIASLQLAALSLSQQDQSAQSTFIQRFHVI